MNDTLEPRFIFIFDLDGLLIDTSLYHYLAWKKITEQFDFEFTQSMNTALKGQDRMQSLNKIIQMAGLTMNDSEKQQLANEKNDLYLSYISTLNEKDIMPGVENFIKEAIRIKIPLAIGSGGKNTVTLLEKTGLKKYFEVIVDGNMVSKPKPDPEIYLTVAKKTGYEPKRCVVFEDSQTGVTAGKNAGMYVVGIGNPDYLQQANLVFNSLENVRAHEIANWFSIL